MEITNRHKKIGIRKKMHLYIGVPVGIIMAVAFSMVIITTREAAREAAIEQSTQMLKANSGKISQELGQAISFSEAISASVGYMYDLENSDRVVLVKSALQNLAQHNPQYESIFAAFELRSIDPTYLKEYGRRTFQIFKGSHEVVTIDKDLNGFDTKTLYYKLKTTGKPDVRDPYEHSYYNSGKTKVISTVSAPIWNRGRFAGNAGVHLPIDAIQKVVQDIKPFPKSEAAIATSDGTIFAHSNTRMVGKNLQDFVPNLLKKNGDFLPKLKNGEAAGVSLPIAGISCYTIFIPINIANTDTFWILSVSIPNSELYAKARVMAIYGMLIALVGLLLTLLAINFIANKISAPLQDVTTLIGNLSKGDISDRKVKIETGDEIEEIADSVNILVEGLHRTAKFAQEIGNGNLTATHSTLSEKDTLGKSLEEMRKNLQKASDIEKERHEEEQKNSWANRGYTIFADLLRQNHDNLSELSSSIISNLVKYLDINQGGMFIVNENAEEGPQLEMTACFAFNRKKMLKRQFGLKEGLIGRCYSEGEPIYLLEIPKNYIFITSGLGDMPPQCLLLVPLKVDSEVNGVLELASLTPIEEHKVRFVEKIAESIAATLSSVRINLQTAELLAQTRQQAEEMAAQEEEMRQNLEELQSTQEEMNRIQQKQKIAQAELSKEQMLFKNLLDFIPEMIYFKDLSGRMIRVSKSLLDKNHAEESTIIGKSDEERFGEMGKKTWNDELTIMQTGVPILNFEEKFTYPDGSFDWFNTSKLPLKNALGEVIGTFGITRDIKDFKQREQDYECEKSALDLLMNSFGTPTYVTDAEGKFLKVNRTALEIFGFSSEESLVGKAAAELNITIAQTATNQPNVVQAKIVNPASKTATALLSVAELRHESGLLGYLYTGRDESLSALHSHPKEVVE